MIAFVTNAVAQWNQNPVIEETHWFGQYEYVDYQNGFDQRKINWSNNGEGNFIESIEIKKSVAGAVPKTSFYSWLDHKLRFSVDSDDKETWIIGEAWNGDDANPHYNAAYSRGQGLKNESSSAKNFYVHNLNAGDQVYIRYYDSFADDATELNSENGGINISNGIATIPIPRYAVIRNVVITLAEYVASDFKVEEVKGNDATALSTAYNTFLKNQGKTTQEFGDLGYKYSFKGPGVLEDKRGAAPYITMKFGNDNDMTFVRALGDVTIQYGDLTETEAKCYTKENAGNPVLATGDEFVIHSAEGAENQWDAQFFISAPYALSTGQQFKVEFDYKADHATATSSAIPTQTHTTPGGYIHYDCIGTFNFTDNWVHFEGTATTVSQEMNGMQTIAFNLNQDKGDSNTFYFKNIKLSVPERTETISEDDLAAASIIHSSDLNPEHKHLQYRWTYKGDNYDNPYSEAEIKDRLVGKEWSTFTAEIDPNHKIAIGPSVWSDGVEYVFGDNYHTIWPYCGNYFYFFPEVDGLLEIEYYCEGANEMNAFWYKQSLDGTTYGPDDQEPLLFIHSNGNEDGNRNTDGGNNYKMIASVHKNGVYYLCSLPTNMSHERPIFRLKSYTFIPSFRVAPLYKIVSNTEVNTDATRWVAEVKGGPYHDLDGVTHNQDGYDLTNNTFTRNAEQEARIKCLGNVASATAYLEMKDNKQWLSFKDITFKPSPSNPGGAVVAHVNNGVGQASFVLTIAYDAANAKWNDDKTQRVAATSGGKEVKRWDFYSSKDWDLGQYVEDDGTRYDANEPNGTASNAWKGKSKLFKEVHKADGFTTDWEYDYVDVPNKKEPIFKSIYDMEGDNADMIHETAGLVFLTEPNELGIYNENPNADAEKGYQDRFIGLMGGGKLIIPRLKKDDRVVIKMGCFGNVDGGGNEDFEQKAVLWLTNAKDAKGTVIPEETDYIIGGSMPYPNETSTAKTQPHGEYHFIVNQTSSSDATDFAIEVKEAGLLKIYSIAIYRNAANSNKDILTENMVTTADGPELLFTDDDAKSKDMEFFLRYSGYGEPKVFNGVNNSYTRGNLGELSSSRFETTDDNTVKATFNKGDFGSFRAEMAVKTKDGNNTYVTDYTPGSLAVDYLKKVDDGYPYTWDFTDLLYIKNTSNKYIENAIQTEKGGDLATDYKGWSENAGTLCLRNAPEQEPGILFANGGQIYGANVMFAEMAGIGFKRSTESPEDAKLLNKAMGVKSGALELNSNKKDVFYKLVIPKVDADAAIYVRATPVRSDDKLVAQYSTDGENATDLKVLSVTTPNDDATDDKIYVMKNEGGEQNIELWLNGMVIKKIAVATDEKKVNDEGWNTESRAHATDPTLLPYMTGKDFRTYIVKEGAIDATNKVVTLQRVDGGKGKDSDGSEDKDDKNTIVIPAATDGSPNACIVRYVGDEDGEDIFEDGNGFHLFAPDMHDKPAANAKIPNSLLRAQVSNTDDSKVVPREQTIEGTTYYNYAFTNKYKYVDENGEQLEGREGQYTGKQAFYRIMESGAKSGGNQAYLSITTSPAPTRLVLFIDGEDSEATGIATVENSVGGENARFYNLNGQQLSGKPNRSGLYIVNGKKISIKNK